MRALVVGAGRMGTHHARIARALGLDVKTVDPRRPADHPSIAAAGSADVAVIATPIVELASAACETMRLGCARMLVEKPLAATVREAEAVLACAEQTGTELFVGYSDRFHPLVQDIRRELIGRVGTVRELAFERHAPAPIAPGPGSQIDLAVHDLDLLRFFGFDQVVRESRCTAEATHAVLDCDGATATVDARYSGRSRVRRLTIRGLLGVIECDLVAQFAELTLSAANGHGRNGTVRRPGDRSHEPLFNQFAGLLAGEGTTGAEGLATLRIATALGDVSASAREADRRRRRPPREPARP